MASGSLDTTRNVKVGRNMEKNNNNNNNNKNKNNMTKDEREKQDVSPFG